MKKILVLLLAVLMLAGCSPSSSQPGQKEAFRGESTENDENIDKDFLQALTNFEKNEDNKPVKFFYTNKFENIYHFEGEEPSIVESETTQDIHFDGDQRHGQIHSISGGIDRKVEVYMEREGDIIQEYVKISDLDPETNEYQDSSRYKNEQVLAPLGRGPYPNGYFSNSLRLSLKEERDGIQIYNFHLEDGDLDEFFSVENITYKDTQGYVNIDVVYDPQTKQITSIRDERDFNSNVISKDPITLSDGSQRILKDPIKFENKSLIEFKDIVMGDQVENIDIPQEFLKFSEKVGF